jgi:hypothetical protein
MSEISEGEITKKYTDPKYPGSFASISSFLKDNKFADLQFVRNSLEDLETYTKFRQKKVKRNAENK